jgi:hypothetical protein
MGDKSGEQPIEYGVVPIDVMASMSGLDFVRAIFARRLPEPPIMQTVEPFDCTAEPGVVVIHSVPGLRRPPRRHRRGEHHRCKRPAACACDNDVPCARDFEEERKKLTPSGYRCSVTVIA